MVKHNAYWEPNFHFPEETPKTAHSKPSLLSAAESKDIIKLLRFLSADIKRKGVHLNSPPSWLIKQVIEQSGVDRYNARNWVHDCQVFLQAIETKVKFEEAGDIQFNNSDNNEALFGESAAYTLSELLIYIRALKKYVVTLENELH